MAFSDGKHPTKLVICVDGTQYNPAGTGKFSSGETSIRRIYAGTRRGKCQDQFSGETFNQVVKYIPGIGLADNAISTDRLQATLLGQGPVKQIQEVYEDCCQLNGARDEVWLFGFGRGAYVVRAVAGLLHRFGAIASAGSPEFGKDFRKILKEAEQWQGPGSIGLSPISSTTSSTVTRPAPKIQFIGVFDTVKADGPSFDVAFNGSIKHMRHALALHEDRKALTPEYVFPEEFYGSSLKEDERTCIQAWFIGSHNDMGGSAKKAGLGLYPLQWMVLEAEKCGLHLDPTGSSSDAVSIHHPLSVVFPKSDSKHKGMDSWSCTTANGITVTMRDIRSVHEIVRHNEDYSVKLDTRFGSIRQKKAREAFLSENVYLRGYCDWAPQGTIIHPSVYLVLDEHIGISLETKELELQRQIEDYREKMLGSKDGIVNTGFWLDGEDDMDDSVSAGAIRVLVCGNTGVGKSTLINKTFGVDVTTSSNRIRGIHDVRQEITFEGRPDLVLHDSGGFEAGADDEFLAIEAFLREKANAPDVMDRLHVIWFCVDINSPRTLQTATEKLFRAVSEHATDCPIVVIATKKDDFLDLEFSKRRKTLKKEGKRFDEEACDEYAEEQLQERIEIIRKEMESVSGGRLDACLAVSQDDSNSIAELSKTTSHCFDTDKVRLLYVRAQVTRIDLKVDMALAEVLRRYKKLIRSSTGSSFAPFGATVNRRVSTNMVTKAIINCFGLPTVSAEVAVEALNTNVWSALGSNIVLALAETFHLIGCVGTGFAAGIPAWAVTGAINSTYVVPATCRLFLIMSCDLTFVLARSFKEVTFRASGQPNEKDVGSAARNYRIRGYAQHVHRDVKRLVPRRNMLASYKVDKIRQGLDDIFARYKDKLMEDVNLPLKVRDMRIETADAKTDSLYDETSTEADSTLFSDLKEASNTLAELEANPAMAELEANAPAELSAEPKISELAHSPSTVTKRPEPKINELAHSSSTVKKRSDLSS